MTDKDKNHEHDKDKHAPPPPAAKEPQEAKPTIAGGSKGATGQPAVALGPEAYMTEQEKEALKDQPAAKKETK